jgi:hypothetical protein
MTGEGQDRVNRENLEGAATRDGHFPSDCFSFFLMCSPTAGWRARESCGFFFFSSWLVWLLCVYIGSSVKGLFFFFFFSCWLLFLDVFRVSRCHVTRQTCHVTYITATPLAPLSHPLHHLSSLIALHSVTNFPFFSFFLRHSQSQVWKLFDLTADNDACLNHYQISAFEVD